MTMESATLHVKLMLKAGGTYKIMDGRTVTVIGASRKDSDLFVGKTEDGQYLHWHKNGNTLSMHKGFNIDLKEVPNAAA